MTQHIQLHIPTPCHENWNAMTATDQGRFCKSCCKEVIDFSVMADREILNYLSKAGSNVCGRVQDDQLNRTIQQPAQKKYTFPYLWRMLLASILVSNKLSAQVKPPTDTVVTVPFQNTLMKSLEGRVGGIAVVSKEYKPALEISGKVVDQAGNPIPSATIIIKGTQKGVIADSAGFYKLNTFASPNRTELVVSSVGFVNQVLPLSGYTSQQTLNANRVLLKIDITLVESKDAMMGEVVVGSITPVRKRMTTGLMSTITRQNIFESIANKLTDKTISVYPNPITTNNIFNLVFNPKQLGIHTLQFTDASGKIIHSSEINIVSKNQVQYFNGSMFNASGIYFASISSKQSNRPSTVKLLVQ